MSGILNDDLYKCNSFLWNSNNPIKFLLEITAYLLTFWWKWLGNFSDCLGKPLRRNHPLWTHLEFKHRAHLVHFMDFLGTRFTALLGCKFLMACCGILVVTWVVKLPYITQSSHNIAIDYCSVSGRDPQKITLRCSVSKSPKTSFFLKEWPYVPSLRHDLHLYILYL